VDLVGFAAKADGTNGKGAASGCGFPKGLLELTSGRGHRALPLVGRGLRCRLCSVYDLRGWWLAIVGFCVYVGLGGARCVLVGARSLLVKLLCGEGGFDCVCSVRGTAFVIFAWCRVSMCAWVALAVFAWCRDSSFVRGAAIAFAWYRVRRRR
jgi:hypothetical protein